MVTRMGETRGGGRRRLTVVGRQQRRDEALDALVGGEIDRKDLGGVGGH
jgi:hypothetical protein